MHIQGPFCLLKSTGNFPICNAKHSMTTFSARQKIQMNNDIKLDHANSHLMHATGRIRVHEHIILVIVLVKSRLSRGNITIYSQFLMMT